MESDGTNHDEGMQIFSAQETEEDCGSVSGGGPTERAKFDQVVCLEKGRAVPLDFPVFHQKQVLSD
jgi:hypothetical protein